MATRRTTEQPDIKPETIAILLAGWGGKEAPEPSPHGFGGGFLELYDPDNAGIMQMWREHEQFLRATAARWGWEPTHTTPDGRRVFYAEWIADHGGRGR